MPPQALLAGRIALIAFLAFDVFAVLTALAGSLDLPGIDVAAAFGMMGSLAVLIISGFVRVAYWFVENFFNRKP